MEELQTKYEDSEPDENIKWQQGEFCVVKYSRDGQWYRAKIEQIDGEQVQVK